MVSTLFNTRTKEAFLNALVYFFLKARTFGKKQKVIFQHVMRSHIDDLHVIENLVQRFSEFDPYSVGPKIAESIKKLGIEFEGPPDDLKNYHCQFNKFMKKIINCIGEGMLDANFLKDYANALKPNIIWNLLSKLSINPLIDNQWFKLISPGQTFRCFMNKSGRPLNIGGLTYHRAKNLDTEKEFFYVEAEQGDEKGSEKSKDKTHLFEPTLIKVSEYYKPEIESIWVFENMNYFQSAIPNILSPNQICNIYEGIVKMIEHFQSRYSSYKLRY